MGPDLVGPYCGTRDDVCCPSRDDECMVPILDTSVTVTSSVIRHHLTVVLTTGVYVRTRNPLPPLQDTTFLARWDEKVRRANAIPSLSSSYLDIRYEAGCRKHGREYAGGDVIEDNCNTCTCAQEPLLGGVYNWKCTNHICLIQPDLLRKINDGQFGWKAGNYSSFWGKTLDDGIRYKLGTLPPDTAVMNMTAVQNDVFEVPPEEFDAREKWANYIHPVRDQGDCGASWAFSTVAVAGDRLAIESSGLLSDVLSPQQLLSCNVASGQLGCDGGALDKAWWFIRKNGIVTEECYPYSSGQSGQAGECLLTKGVSSVACVTNSSKTTLHATPSYRVANDEREIMVEILNNGPVQATFRVKEDFFMYKSGVYSYTGTSPDNLPDDMQHIYHSVRLVGWGVETQEDGTETKYWIAVNSWGESWGEDGSFRIRRGDDQTDIQEHVIGVHGDILAVLAAHPSEDIRDQGLYNIYNRKPVKIPVRIPKPRAISG
ncbi:hypothetical protein FSP39_000846 [Pinctada imbricata]|uniref:Peptidase C1A papain C-terminal domain-containing protein n=1 Tax=Pinctada imbricata TaxID=66713 RepID=A0AA88XXT4_PINIB|nr:hypothetical protein FSP39_000846 [Pinctada imbricata]